MEVYDNAIDHAVAFAAIATWPAKDDRRWHRYQTPHQNKYATRDANGMTPAATECVRQIIEAVEVPLWCFPDYDLHGAGMHVIPPGGWLSKHLDSDHHPITGWARRYSAVLCVNPHWDMKWGGAFELGDKTVYPSFNRLVIFETTDDAWHEVTKVTGPSPRCTISVFFWSADDGKRNRPQAEFAP